MTGGVDVGNWVKVEVQVPDTLGNYPQIKIYAWDGTKYNAWGWWNVCNPEIYAGSSEILFLDGTRASDIFPVGCG